MLAYNFQNRPSLNEVRINFEEIEMKVRTQHIEKEGMEMSIISEKTLSIRPIQTKKQT